ncbi:hypothetical protein HK096_001051, partial [Nowakowskiella sp. JEL0078]
MTLLGPFFSRTSIFPDIDASISQTYFPTTSQGTSASNIQGLGVGNRNTGDVKSSISALRVMEVSITNIQYEIVMSIIKAGSEQRDEVIKYFADVINANISRGKMQVERREVSTDGFFFNILRVLLRLCDPFLDPQFRKLHLIDPHYLKHTKRFDFSEHTRLNDDVASAKAYFEEYSASNAATVPNFISDVFYVTLAAHHYGVISTMRFYGSFVKDAEELKNHVARMMGEALDPMREQMLKRFQSQLDTVISHKLAMDAALLDPVVIAHSL